MNSPQVIGILGKKQHGKDTIANYMVEKYGYIRVAFADAIKDMLKCSFRFSEEQLNGNLKETIDEFWQIKPRQVLQFVGTELFRDKMGELLPHVETNFWVFIIKKKIHDTLKVNPSAKFVISDCRFENEVNFIKEMGGQVIRVVRPTVENNTESNHSSEKYIDDLPFDFKIVNNASLDKLHSNVDIIISSLK
jgi:hypothetical protein